VGFPAFVIINKVTIPHKAEKIKEYLMRLARRIYLTETHRY